MMRLRCGGICRVLVRFRCRVWFRMNLLCVLKLEFGFSLRDRMKIGLTVMVP